MSEVMKWCARVFSGLCAWLCWCLGGWDAALGLLFLVIGLDLATGLLCAFTLRSDKTRGSGFLSGELYRGLTRKLMMVALVILATALDRMMGSGGVARLSVIGFYAANEGLSILVNAARLGLPFPKSLLAVLEKMKAGEDEGGGQGRIG